MYSLVLFFLPGAVSDEIAYRRQAPEFAAAGIAGALLEVLMEIYIIHAINDS